MGTKELSMGTSRLSTLILNRFTIESQLLTFPLDASDREMALMMMMIIKAFNSSSH